LPIGTYTVTVTQPGFKTFVATSLTVDVATERRVDAALTTGQVSARVEVSGDELPLVESTSSVLGGTLTTEMIESVPVNGRDYTKLIYLTGPDIRFAGIVWYVFHERVPRSRQQFSVRWHRHE
jgi:hypothetical protein